MTTQAKLSAQPNLEVQIAETGDRLLEGLSGVLDALPTAGPQALANHLGIDKVLASRVLKAFKNTDPMAVVHRSPGPEPLRRVLQASAKRGVPGGVIDRASEAVDRFEVLIRDQIGDRSALEAIVSSWVPEARREFELRRKQAAFRALSQLKGAQASVNLSTAIIAPNAKDDRRIDIVWLTGLLDLRRLRPGAGVKFATRRVASPDGDRRPCNLAGEPIEDMRQVQLPEFCSKPTPELEVTRVGESVHYTLGANGFGPKSGVSVVFAEVNLAELPRYIPAEQGRKTYVFAEILTPAKLLQFDFFVHPDLYPGQDPSLRIYDTASEGIANINDPARDIDQLDMMESIERLGVGMSRCRSAAVPRYSELLQRVCTGLGWDGEAFRAYRCRIDYPLYGSQIAMAFDTVAPPLPGEE